MRRFDRFAFVGTTVLAAFTLASAAELVSCAPALDGAVVATNAAAELGDRTEAILADAYRREQQACVTDTDREPDAVQCVHLARERYAGAWKAYDRFRTSWLATAAAVQAAQAAQALGQTPDVSKALALASALVRAETALSAAAKEVAK